MIVDSCKQTRDNWICCSVTGDPSLTTADGLQPPSISYRIHISTRRRHLQLPNSYIAPSLAGDHIDTLLDDDVQNRIMSAKTSPPPSFQTKPLASYSMSIFRTPLSTYFWPQMQLSTIQSLPPARYISANFLNKMISTIASGDGCIYLDKFSTSAIFHPLPRHP